ncbi:exopolysaccharide biosynthesis polyprenyl glycosylphosphotransferase [Verrucomicrobiota bacterium]
MFRSKRIDNLWLFNFMADFLAITAAYYTTLLIRFRSASAGSFFAAVRDFLNAGGTGAPSEQHEVFYIISAPRIILYMALVLCVMYALQGLYPGRKFIRRRSAAWNVILANAAALAIFYIYFYISRNVFHPRSIFGTILFLNIIYCVIFRWTMNHLLAFIRSCFNVDKCGVILVGSNDEADLINRYIEQFHPHGMHIAERAALSFDSANLRRQGYGGQEATEDKSQGKSGNCIDDQIRKLGELASRHGADIIILTDQELSIGQIMRFLEMCENLNIAAKILSSQLGILVNQARIPSDIIQGIPLVHFEAPSKGKRFVGIRRSAWTISVFTATVAFLPLAGLIALLIKLTSKGPVLFTQERIGVNRKLFKMFKFRTMYNKADEAQAQIEKLNESGKGLFKIRKDPRVTPVGRFLRRFSLDELPQLINVFRGEMTVVGPRPLPRRDFENYYEDWHYGRHGGLPGLTCLWQISGRSDINFHNMCILDMYYLRNQSWVLDLKILLKTMWAVLFAEGAY